MKIFRKITCSANIPEADCVMIDKYGNVYSCIDNKYHPNPGNEEDEYSEIERVIDWLIDKRIYPIEGAIDSWLRSRLSGLFLEGESLDESIVATMFCDTYKPCKRILDKINKIWNEYTSNPDIAEDDTNIDELSECRKIANYLNQHFLRVRYGGKLDFYNENKIYFRISSIGYDWKSVIVDFLWDTFSSPEKMPATMWVGHDAETNPPETCIYEGSTSAFIENFDKIAASTQLH